MVDKSQLEVVNITNIDEEDDKGFEGMYGGETYFLNPGETKPYPRFLGEHLANQLANKILIREDKSWTDMAFKKPLLQQIIGQIAVPVAPVAPEPSIPEVAPEFVEVPKEEEPIKAPELEPEPKPKKRGRKKKE